tara:strand:- start:5186 stop:6223 length:1038 start_codon:yes stop_codon:yes gene_type:complete
MSTINTEIPEDLTNIEGFTPETTEEKSVEETPIIEEKVEEPPIVEETPESTIIEDKRGDGEEDADKVSVFDTWKDKYGVDEFTHNPDESIDVTVQNFIDKALEVNKNKTIEQVKEELYASNPLHKLIDEGNIRNQETVEYGLLAQQYNDLSIDEFDVDQQEQIVAEELKLKGLDNDEIAEQIDFLKEKDKLFDRSQKATKVIAKVYNNAFEQQQEIDKKAQIQINKELNELKQSLRVQVDNDLYGIKLPKQEADEFYKYITEPVDTNGNTAADIAYYNASIKQKAMIDFLLKNDFKQLSKAVNTTKPSLKELSKLNDERVKPKAGSPDSATNKILTMKEMESYFK